MAIPLDTIVLCRCCSVTFGWERSSKTFQQGGRRGEVKGKAEMNPEVWLLVDESVVGSWLSETPLQLLLPQIATGYPAHVANAGR